jgi:demethylmenaquinone methyltransferase/2-methoxy-6-polyprenyl-1,4-benzoquinol methylase
MPLFDHFDLLAPIYPRAIKLSPLTPITDLVDCPEGGILLDAAGGTGRVAAAFEGGGRRIYISDSSLGMLRQAKNNSAYQLSCALTERLPYPSESFDRIMMVDALHHIINARQTASELWRVLKPGGRIVIQEPDIRTFAVKLIALAEKIALMRSHFYTAEEVAAFFKLYNPGIAIHRDGFNAWVVIEKPFSINQTSA